MHCIVHYSKTEEKEIETKEYFIVSFYNSFVIFDKKFLVKVIVKQAHAHAIIHMIMIENSNVLVTACAVKNEIKFWNISKLELENITSVWISCFRDVLGVSISQIQNGSRVKYNSIMLNNVNNEQKEMEDDDGQSLESNECMVDSESLLMTTLVFHSGPITCLTGIDEHCFVSGDELNQIILWKDGFVESFKQNQAIKKHFHML